MNTKLDNILRLVVVLTGFGLLIYFLYWRLQFGLTRYFDADELAHLHWGHNFFAGRMPYTDFFYIFPPYFLFLLSSIWSLFGNTLTVVIEARMVIFVFFLFLIGVVFLFGKMMRNMWVGLFAVLLLCCIPIPYDKMLEVRPDLPAVVFAFAGMYFFVKGVLTKNHLLYLFISGVLYGISIGIVPKTLFFLPPILISFAFWYWRQKIHIKPALRIFLIWVIGLGLPLLGVLIFAIASGNPVYAINLMSTVASDASLELVTIYNHSFYMFPTHFFWPNQTFYGEGGMNFQYYLNLFIWIGGSVFAIVAAVTFLLRDTFRKQLVTLLLVSTFFFNLYGFVYVFPLKHSQYLIPVVPFVCLFLADFIEEIRGRLEKRHSSSGFLLCMGVFIVLFYMAQRTNTPKQFWLNTSDMEKFKQIETIIPSGSYVYDLGGYALSFTDPYYYCCVPYGQYWRVLPYKPSLIESLKKTETHYIINTRLDTLTAEERQYIEATYTTSSFDGMILSK